MSDNSAANSSLSGSTLRVFAGDLQTTLELMTKNALSGKGYEGLPTHNATHYQTPEDVAESRLRTVDAVLKPLVNEVKRISREMNASLSRTDFQNILTRHLSEMNGDKETLADTRGIGSTTIPEHVQEDNRMILRHMDRTLELIKAEALGAFDVIAASLTEESVRSSSTGTGKTGPDTLGGGGAVSR